MTLQTASKNFNLNRDILGEAPRRHNDFSVWVGGMRIPLDAVVLFILGHVILFSEIDFFRDPEYYPVIYPLMIGIGLIVSGIVSIKIFDLTEEKRIRPVCRIVIGAILLIYIPLYYFYVPFIPFFAVYVICFIVKYIPALFLWGRFMKRRCTLPVTAVCIGLEHEEIHTGKSAQDYTVFHPVWEYKVPVRGEVLDEESIIPATTNGMVEKAFRGSLEPWTEQGVPRYGETREILVNPKDQTDVFYYEYAAIPAAILGAILLICGMILFTLLVNG